MNTLQCHPSLRQVVADAFGTAIMHAPGVYTKPFALFSANLYQCLPKIPVTLHETLYQKACAHQALAVAEQRCPHQLERLKAMNIPSHMYNQPGIVVTYHTGSYRLIGKWLAMHGFPVTLVIASGVLEQQGDTYRRLVAEAVPGSRFDLLDAERADALLRMRAALREGRYLLVYVDGNTGTAPLHNTAVIPFLDSELRVRTGVAHLARLMSCPIYPAINRRMPGGDTVFQCPAPLWVPQSANKDTNRDAACSATAALYSLLAATVVKMPEQWESWFYLHEHLTLPETSTDKPADEADPAWITFRQYGRDYRLHRRFFTYYPA